MNQAPPPFPSEPIGSPAHSHTNGPAPTGGMPGPQQAQGYLPSPPSAASHPYHGAPTDHFPTGRWSWWHQSYVHPPPMSSSYPGHVPAASIGAGGNVPPHLPPSHGYEQISWHGRYPTRSFCHRGYRRGPRLLPLILVGTAVYFATKTYYRRHPPLHEYDQQDRQSGYTSSMHSDRHACGPWAVSRHGWRVEPETRPQREGLEAGSPEREAAANEELKPKMTRLEARLKAREQEWASRWERAMQEQRERQSPPEKWV